MNPLFRTVLLPQTLQFVEVCKTGAQVHVWGPPASLSQAPSPQSSALPLGFASLVVPPPASRFASLPALPRFAVFLVVPPLSRFASLCGSFWGCFSLLFSRFASLCGFVLGWLWFGVWARAGSWLVLSPAFPFLCSPLLRLAGSSDSAGWGRLGCCSCGRHRAPLLPCLLGALCSDQILGGVALVHTVPVMAVRQCRAVPHRRRSTPYVH